MFATYETINALLTTGVFTHESYEIVKNEDTLDLLDTEFISLSALDYLTQHVVGPEHNLLVTVAMYQHIPVDDRIRLMTRLLEKGTDVNNQCSWLGNSVLAEYIECVDSHGNEGAMWVEVDGVAWDPNQDFPPNEEDEEEEEEEEDDVDESRRLLLLDARRIVTFLLENGADPLLENKQGVSPIARNTRPYYYITPAFVAFLEEEMRKYE